MADARPNSAPRPGPHLVPVWVVIAVALAVIGLAMLLSGPANDGSWRTNDGDGAGARSLATSQPTEWTPPATASTVAHEPGARLVVKFVDGAGIRLLYGELISVAGTDLTEVEAVLARYPDTVVEPLLNRAEDLHDLLEEATGDVPPDLTLYYRLTLVAGMDADAAVADLGGLAVVQWVYAEP